MPKTEFEKHVESAIAVLSEFFPLKSYLYFPLLSTVLKWAVERTHEWRQKILSWEVFLDAGYVQTKSDAFVLEFFEGNPDLQKTYQQEIHKQDIQTLRKAFSRLYPVLGLEDPFLSALFFDQLEVKDFKKIEKEFDQRVLQAKQDIGSLRDKSRLMKGLETFKEEMESFSHYAGSQPDVLRMLREIIKKNVGKSDD
jgi:hypothetical protein